MWVNNPYIQMGKKLYDLCMMYDEEGTLDEHIIPDISLVRKVMEYVLDDVNAVGCTSNDELLRMLIVNYHINYFAYVSNVDLSSIKNIIDEHYQFSKKQELPLSRVEDFLREDILEDLRISAIMNCIEKSNDLSHFKNHLEEKVLCFIYPDADIRLFELFNQDYSVLEELFMGYIKNYIYYFERDITTLDLELGCNRYDFYQQEFGNAMIERYQAPFTFLLELESRLFKNIIMKENQELIFAQFLYQFEQFLTEHYAMVDETYLPTLIHYMKKSNPNGYLAMSHVLLKTAYLNLRVLPNKTKEQFQLLDKLRVLDFKEEELAGYNYFFELFSEVVNIPVLQEKILEENDKAYVKKFDHRFKGKEK